MEKLSGSARYFFEREFFDRSFGPTKKQIAKRLWGVLATPSFERMFAQAENKIDMFDLLNCGSVVLISTAKDLLKQEGCELFGRRLQTPRAFNHPAQQFPVHRQQIHEHRRIIAIVVRDRKHVWIPSD